MPMETRWKGDGAFPAMGKDNEQNSRAEQPGCCAFPRYFNCAPPFFGQFPRTPRPLSASRRPSMLVLHVSGHQLHDPELCLSPGRLTREVRCKCCLLPSAVHPQVKVDEVQPSTASKPYTLLGGGVGAMQMAGLSVHTPTFSSPSRCRLACPTLPLLQTLSRMASCHWMAGQTSNPKGNARPPASVCPLGSAHDKREKNKST
ncbi:hypothetical protein B0T22DRAFT_105864 [Podospora appendiculata]|uniref:Uncharacterized protein n=1 Tax=Podospora appendiculata TaxID=314037 RepID=A0AAE1CIL4_9PEZI|nr:hypothetical protein B0T22DRAFT_105864 [Podospora appendiculata]